MRQSVTAAAATPEVDINGMSKLGELLAGRRLDPAKPHTGSVGVVDVNTIQKQHKELIEAEFSF